MTFTGWAPYTRNLECVSDNLRSYQSRTPGRVATGVVVPKDEERKGNESQIVAGVIPLGLWWTW